MGWPMLRLSKSFPWVPPVTSTVPSGRSVALCWRRRNFMGAATAQAGFAAFKSMISTMLVGAPPPMKMTLPTSYITDGA